MILEENKQGFWSLSVVLFKQRHLSQILSLGQATKHSCSVSCETLVLPVLSFQIYRAQLCLKTDRTVPNINASWSIKLGKDQEKSAFIIA